MRPKTIMDRCKCDLTTMAF